VPDAPRSLFPRLAHPALSLDLALGQRLLQLGDAGGAGLGAAQVEVRQLRQPE